MGVDVSTVFAEPLAKCCHDLTYYVLNGCNSERQTPGCRCKFANPREGEEEETEVL